MVTQLTSRDELLDSLRQPALSPLTTQALWLAGEYDDVGDFLAEALPAVVENVKADYAGVMAPDGGDWNVVAFAGTRQRPPIALLSEALDRDAETGDANWIVTPLHRQGGNGHVLAVHASPSALTAARPAVRAFAPLLGHAIGQVQERYRDRRRIRRLEAILEIAGQWNQMHEMEPLLVQMAEAATKLLAADRASIFLWDRPNKILVGRPALGVEGNELRIPDDKGLVGKVVQSGEPGRVDRTHGQEQIDRSVDTKLKYQTETLVCVPLRGARGDIFGAFEVINKKDGNFTAEDEAALMELAQHAAIALENTQEREQLLKMRRQMSEQAAEKVRLVGESAAIAALRSTIDRVANTELAVLILGDNGTGKEVVAQRIHYQSNRRDQPFIAVNCAAITETLLESELFGHEKGAFTGADERRIGKFELASGGTLFLDEIGDMSPGGQSKLLRVLEQKEVVRVGGSTPIHTDARVIAATNQDLADMVRQKKFRQDLFYRLNVVTLHIPPLRERPDDILLLGEHFLHDFCQRARRKLPKFSAEAKRRLTQHTWPGNVRELRNLMERLAYLTQGDTVEMQDLGFILAPADEAPAWVPTDQPLTDATQQFQTEYIKKAISRSKGNMSDAAERLGLHRSNLYRKMRQLGMAVD
jgi:transcriptional regulator with GAF, ATPase, and Fis domain